VLDCDADRSVYLKLLRENLALYKVSLIGYCLMSNHIHLIAVPRTADGLAQALKHTHGRYASYWNAAHQSNGHVWQGRYYSCPLDEPHLWEALRYTELNPLRDARQTKYPPNRCRRIEINGAIPERDRVFFFCPL
jgi:putative transposase